MHVYMCAYIQICTYIHIYNKEEVMNFRRSRGDTRRVGARRERCINGVYTILMYEILNKLNLNF